MRRSILPAYLHSVCLLLLFHELIFKTENKGIDESADLFSSHQQILNPHCLCTALFKQVNLQIIIVTMEIAFFFFNPQIYYFFFYFSLSFFIFIISIYLE